MQCLGHNRHQHLKNVGCIFFSLAANNLQQQCGGSQKNPIAVINSLAVSLGMGRVDRNGGGVLPATI